MASLYLTAVGTTNFIRVGIGRDFENAPPIILFGLLRGLLTFPLTLSLSLALLLGLPPPLFSLAFLFDPSLGLTPLRFIPLSLGFSLLFGLPPTFGVLFLPEADFPRLAPKRHQPERGARHEDAVNALVGWLRPD